MPQFSTYPTTSQLLAADTILTYKDAAGAIKQITGENLAAAIKLLMSRALDITILTSATTLDENSEFIICNSGSTFIVTLPESTDSPGVPIYLSNKGAGTVSIVPTGSDTIAGESGISVIQYASVILIPDGLGMYHVFGFTI